MLSLLVVENGDGRQMMYYSNTYDRISNKLGHYHTEKIPYLHIKLKALFWKHCFRLLKNCQVMQTLVTYFSPFFPKALFFLSCHWSYGSRADTAKNEEGIVLMFWDVPFNVAANLSVSQNVRKLNSAATDSHTSITCIMMCNLIFPHNRLCAHSFQMKEPSVVSKQANISVISWMYWGNKLNGAIFLFKLISRVS